MNEGRPRGGGYLRAVVGLTLVLAILGGAWSFRRRARTSGDERLARIVAASPFRNVAPGVAYVGDAECARCHAAIAESFHAHPMGRSVMPAEVATGSMPGAAAREATFEAQGYRYSVERRDGRPFHREQRLDAAGLPVAEIGAPVGHALGSGELGHSFLVERDGFVYQSPITWYSPTRSYDLAPSYHSKNYHFERVIIPECLSCHVDGAHPAGGALNRYEAPLQLRPIGCERCHGPGALHVGGAGLGREGFDPTIVNPRRLTPVLRDSVCEQCHLQGDLRMERYGRNPADFRPGLPFDEFVAVFFVPEKLDRAKLVGQVEQMRASRCYEASGRALGCISCHDPHGRPAPARRVEHFRASCLACHDSHGCSLPEPDRRSSQPEDSCIACHMPRRDAADVAHVSMTDHRVPRRPGAYDPPAVRALGTMPVVRFESARVDRPSGVEADRDVGLALFQDLQRRWRPEMSPEGPRRALALLDPALSAHPDDLAAMEAKAHLLWMQNRTGEAFEVFQAALRKAPEHERLLETTASLARVMDRRDESVNLLRHAIALNPYCAEYQGRLAQWQADAGDWPEAGRSARAAAAAPISLARRGHARLVVVESLFRTGDRVAAEAELRRLLAFNPPNADAIRRRFAGAR